MTNHWICSHQEGRKHKTHFWWVAAYTAYTIQKVVIYNVGCIAVHGLCSLCVALRSSRAQIYLPYLENLDGLSLTSCMYLISLIDQIWSRLSRHMISVYMLHLLHQDNQEHITLPHDNCKWLSTLQDILVSRLTSGATELTSDMSDFYHFYKYGASS